MPNTASPAAHVAENSRVEFNAHPFAVPRDQLTAAVRLTHALVPSLEHVIVQAARKDTSGVLKLFGKLFGAVPIPDFEGGVQGGDALVDLGLVDRARRHEVHPIEVRER